jgi:predicted AAA+ superfamily ATPase
MVFLSGPRQVGKTTLSKEIAKGFKNNIYFNWDILDHKKLLIKNPTFFENLNRKDESIPLVILDEIHKYRHWKNYLKGIYDEFFEDYKFLVSGSGRLDLYVKGGDSLAGRYFQFHLFPFTVAELSSEKRKFDGFVKDPLKGFDINDKKATQGIWQTLFNIGGFPEPFVKGKKSFFARWTKNYVTQIVREDIRSLYDIKKIDNIEILFALLPSKVGSPLSMNNIAEELQVSFGSIREWLKLFEIFYLTFRIGPWTKRISRAILKEKKLYLFNYPEIDEDSSKFENMVAAELLRAIYNWNEYGYGRFALHYIRNKEKEEVDFLIANNNKPVLLIETKLSEDIPAKSLINFQNILNVPAVQLVNKEGIFKYIKNNRNRILVVTAHRWLSSLP